jgi:hypothetical protein
MNKKANTNRMAKRKATRMAEGKERYEKNFRAGAKKRWRQAVIDDTMKMQLYIIADLAYKVASREMIIEPWSDNLRRCESVLERLCRFADLLDVEERRSFDTGPNCTARQLLSSRSTRNDRRTVKDDPHQDAHEMDYQQMARW